MFPPYTLPRYRLYARTRLGFLFHQRQVKKARERFPHGHSVTQPLVFRGELRPRPQFGAGFGGMLGLAPLFSLLGALP